MIEAKNLSKTYGSLAVLNGVGLQVKTKEIVASPAFWSRKNHTP